MGLVASLSFFFFSLTDSNSSPLHLGLPFSTMPDAVASITRALPGLKEFNYRPENQKHGSSTAVQQQRRAAAEAAAQKELNDEEAANEVLDNLA